MVNAECGIAKGEWGIANSERLAGSTVFRTVVNCRVPSRARKEADVQQSGNRSFTVAALIERRRVLRRACVNVPRRSSTKLDTQSSNPVAAI